MTIRNITRNNSALAGVVEALLLVALVAIILSIIQLTYIPVIMEQKEADHMDVVENQFSNLKSVIEFQSMMGVAGTDMPITYSPTSSPITLGSKKLPYFISETAQGMITINDIDVVGDTYEINIQPMTIPEYSNGIPLTSIEYNAYNFYYLNAQPISYILEGGGIIRDQTEKGEEVEVGRVSPAMNVENRSQDSYIKIYYTIPVFVVHGEKYTSVTYYKDEYIRTNYSSYDTHSGVASFIDIVTEHIDAWEDFISDNTTGLLYEYEKSGYINITKTPTSIRIDPGTLDIRVEITVVKIGIQIGAGSV